MKLNLKTLKYSDILVIGAGAAGGNCIVHLAEYLDKGFSGIKPSKHISWVSTSFSWGTSRMSGSDKQTYYKLGTSAEIANSAMDFAKTLIEGGANHHDLALIEGINSLREFYHLVQLGVPFPEDNFGAFIGYKTDNDPYQCATSAGPLTSKYMSEALERKVREYDIPIYDGYELVDVKRQENVWIALFCDRKGTHRDVDDVPVLAIVCKYLIVATGGPGMLFETTVYPSNQFSTHGILFKAGVIGENLSEWQFGLSSIKPPWNVSGSYMQAIPRIFSKEPGRDEEYEFLEDCFDDPYEAASMIFLKGYQWPFDVKHIDGSSKIDLAVLAQQQAGRKIYLDFTRNISSLEGNFDVNRLSREAREYLIARNATQKLPIDRLDALNTLAIDFYREKGVDLAIAPLEIALCAQHNNGGMTVDVNWQSNIDNLFVIGELAGTHGVRRPGGAALNAGQVGGLRVAQYIARNFESDNESERDGNREKCLEDTREAVQSVVSSWELKTQGTILPIEVILNVRRTMDLSAGVIRNKDSLQQAFDKLSGLYRDVRLNGWRVVSNNDFIAAIRAENLLVTAIAYLHNMLSYVNSRGGSRGSSLIEQDNSFIPENISLRDVVFRTKFNDDIKELCITEKIPIRKCEYESPSFEEVYQKQINTLRR